MRTEKIISVCYFCLSSPFLLFVSFQTFPLWFPSGEAAWWEQIKMGSDPGQILRHLGEGEKQGEGEVRCHYQWPQTEWLAESCQCHSPQHKLQKVLSWRNQFPKTQLPPGPIQGAHCPTNKFEVTRLLVRFCHECSK